VGEIAAEGANALEQQQGLAFEHAGLDAGDVGEIGRPGHRSDDPNAAEEGRLLDVAACFCTLAIHAPYRSRARRLCAETPHLSWRVLTDAPEEFAGLP